MIIAVDRLALGTTKDYETHIAESIDSLAEMYSLYEICDYHLPRLQKQYDQFFRKHYV